MKWKHFPRYWPFVRGIHRSPVNSLHKGQWRGALIFSLICVWINGWVNNREAGDLRRYRAHYDVIVMLCEWNHWWLIMRNFDVSFRVSLNKLLNKTWFEMRWRWFDVSTLVPWTPTWYFRGISVCCPDTACKYDLIIMSSTWLVRPFLHVPENNEKYHNRLSSAQREGITAVTLEAFHIHFVYHDITLTS